MGSGNVKAALGSFGRQARGRIRMTRYIDFTVLYYFKAIKKPYRFVILTLQEKHAREGSQNDMVLLTPNRTKICLEILHQPGKG